MPMRHDARLGRQGLGARGLRLRPDRRRACREGRKKADDPLPDALTTCPRTAAPPGGRSRKCRVPHHPSGEERLGRFALCRGQQWRAARGRRPSRAEGSRALPSRRRWHRLWRLSQRCCRQNCGHLGTSFGLSFSVVYREFSLSSIPFPDVGTQAQATEHGEAGLDLPAYFANPLADPPTITLTPAR